MQATQESSPPSFLSHLKFRVAQPVDIARCYQLECLAYRPESAASKSTLQLRQHHAAPFFRCVLLKNEKANHPKYAFEMFDECGSDGYRQIGNAGEACHHVHHSPQNQLIGYICATRCHDAVPSSESEFRALCTKADAKELSTNKLSEKFHPYPMKHEPNGRYLSIHSVVVQKEYQGLGITRALLQYYIKSIELYCAELDEAGKNRRRNKITKNDANIEKILLLSKSSMVHVFLSVGFRWRATVGNGEDPLYELERDIEIRPSPSGTSLLFPGLQPHPFMEQDCFLVDAFVFATPKGSGNGNPAAIVVLQDSPAKLLADHCNNYCKNIDNLGPLNMVLNGSESWERGEVMNNVMASIVVQEEEESAKNRADAWMQAVAKEINQPATAFVWPLCLEKSRHYPLDSSSFSDDELNLSSQEEEISDGTEVHDEGHYFILCFSQAGVEIDISVETSPTFAAASVLFCQCDAVTSSGMRKNLFFHSENDFVLEASLVSTSLWEESYRHTPSSPVQAFISDRPTSRLGRQSVNICMQSNSARVAINYPWRTVGPAALNEGQAVLTVLRQAFHQALSVVPDENGGDDDTGIVALSISSHHVKFVGVTSEREDLLIELSVDGFNVISGISANFAALKQGCSDYAKGMIICCEVPEALDTDAASRNVLNTCVESDGDNADFQIHFRSRYFDFANSCEGAVSGWLHCALGPYFGVRKGRQRLFGLQCSERGGLVECILNDGEQKVCVVGTAVTKLAGKISIRG